MCVAILCVYVVILGVYVVIIPPPFPYIPFHPHPPLSFPTAPSVTAGVKAINEIIDTDDPDALLDALQNEYVLLENVTEEHRVPRHYFTLLKALKTSKAEVREDTCSGYITLSRYLRTYTAESIVTDHRMCCPRKTSLAACGTVVYAPDESLQD